MNRKENGYKLILLFGYIVLLTPFLYCIFYSMPANDDFAWAIEWFSKNRIIEVFPRVYWNYMFFFGQSGIVAIIMQVLLNPLYWFDNAGHSFGICMVVFFGLIMIGFWFAISKFIEYFFKTSEKTTHILTFLIAALLLMSDYYSDVYNWFSGIPGYSFMIMVELFSFGYIARYEKTNDKKDYRLMLGFGIVACTSMMCCIPMGVFYILYVFIIRKDSGKSFKEKITPLLIFIISGGLMVIAPGNYRRMGIDAQGKASYSILHYMLVGFYKIFDRMREFLDTKPWVLGLLILILMLGYINKPQEKRNFQNILLGFVVIIMSAWGAIILYIAGESKTFESGFAQRIYFVQDYIMIIGFSLLIFSFGQYLSGIIQIEISKSAVSIVNMIVILVTTLVTILTGHISDINQIGIIQNAEVIKDSYYMWNEILDEVKNAPDNTDIIIERQEITWCKFVYYTSLDDSDRPLLGPDDYYGNCNQCASKYYGKGKIKVIIY